MALKYPKQRRRKKFRQRGGTTPHVYQSPMGTAPARRLRQIAKGSLKAENGLVT
jgi:hypothetical protein